MYSKISLIFCLFLTLASLAIFALWCDVQNLGMCMPPTVHVSSRENSAAAMAVVEATVEVASAAVALVAQLCPY
jgi:hypothetical protein